MGLPLDYEGPISKHGNAAEAAAAGGAAGAGPEVAGCGRRVPRAVMRS